MLHLQPPTPYSELPGYDLGAFWAAAGISANVHAASFPYMFHAYPIAFGDVTTASGLVNGIMLGLARRFHTGRGSLVENR